jgi:4-hydroxyproline epimerase
MPEGSETQMSIRRVSVIDSHTGGEPTRVVVEGGPALGDGPLDQRLAMFREKHDAFRSAIVNEPRGSDVLVGALLGAAEYPIATASAIYFNNVGYLGMCGHGTIGLVITLAHLGRISPGRHRIETPVGTVDALWHGDASASVQNVSSFRAVKDFTVTVPGIGAIRGDIAWGGNWFFLVKEHDRELHVRRCAELLTYASQIRSAVNAQGHPEVDHVELFGPGMAGGDSRNFVLCPGGAYDRSPCGTGTSAKLACLAADGLLGEGEAWIQESIIGSSFRGSYKWLDRSKETIIPTITGSAYVTGESTLLLDESDPLCWGIT